MPKPTCPAPQMMTFMIQFLRLERRWPISGGHVGPVRCGDAERSQFSMHRGTLDANKGGGAGDVSTEAADLSHQIFALECLARIAQRKRHDVFAARAIH